MLSGVKARLLMGSLPLLPRARGFASLGARPASRLRRSLFWPSMLQALKRPLPRDTLSLSKDSTNGSGAVSF
jgi:hypothetical protein